MGFSGGRGPEAGDAQYLIDGERDDAEHEMALDLDRAAHAQVPGAEFILQSGVDAFDHGPKIMALRVILWVIFEMFLQFRQARGQDFQLEILLVA